MNRTLVLAEWQRAGQALRAAEVLADAGYPPDALSRAYYTTLHAAKVALSVHNVVTASHAAVRRMFGLQVMQPVEEFLIALGILNHHFGAPIHRQHQ